MALGIIIHQPLSDSKDIGFNDKNVLFLYTRIATAKSHSEP